MRKKEYEDIVGKTIKEIEQTHPKNTELKHTWSRNLIIGVSMAALLMIFIVITVYDRKERPYTAMDQPQSQVIGDVRTNEIDNQEDNQIPDQIDIAGPTYNYNEEGNDEENPEGSVVLDQKDSPTQSDAQSNSATEIETTEAAAASDKTEGLELPPSTVDEMEIISYQIQRGDNFAVVSARYYNTEAYASDIAKFNKMSKDYILHVGDVIILPKDPAGLYTEFPTA